MTSLMASLEPCDQCIRCDLQGKCKLYFWTYHLRSTIWLIVIIEECSWTGFFKSDTWASQTEFISLDSWWRWVNRQIFVPDVSGFAFAVLPVRLFCCAAELQLILCLTSVFCTKECEKFFNKMLYDAIVFDCEIRIACYTLVAQARLFFYILLLASL